MTDLLSADFKTIGIIVLCFGLGFVVIWTWLNAKSADKKADTKPEPERRER